jgi:hypothetical protein
MKFMVIGHWDPANADLPGLLEAEKARTRELAAAGVVEQLLLRQGGAGGFMVVHAASPDAARAQLATLPLMQNAIMTIELFELFELRP